MKNTKQVHILIHGDGSIIRVFSTRKKASEAQDHWFKDMKVETYIQSEDVR